MADTAKIKAVVAKNYSYPLLLSVDESVSTELISKCSAVSPIAIPVESLAHLDELPSSLPFRIVLRSDAGLDGVFALLDKGHNQLVLSDVSSSTADVLTSYNISQRLVCKCDVSSVLVADSKGTEQFDSEAVQTLVDLIKKHAGWAGEFLLDFGATEISQTNSQSLLNALANSELCSALQKPFQLTLTSSNCTLDDAFVDTVSYLSVNFGVRVQTNVDIKENGKDLLLTLAKVLASVLVTDRNDGLFTTVVVDELGVALGLVYSSAASLAEALRKQRGVYWSRSRNSLWEKGLTSGDVQELLRVDYDCDRDALRFTVRQTGNGFCHLQRYNCWNFPQTHSHSELGSLFRLLQQRLISAPPGSYTKRLFQDEKLLGSKLKEECGELLEALEDYNKCDKEAADPKSVRSLKQHVSFEAADVLYFLGVGCASAGITLADIESNLHLKSLRVRRRKGDAKPGDLKAQAKTIKPPSKKLKPNNLFRPCIDIRKGKVTQIVGATLASIIGDQDNDNLADDTNATVNHISNQSAGDFANMYSKLGLQGGHIILLDRQPETQAAALEALTAAPNTLQVGGGITPENAQEYIDAGATHVVVTSYIFSPSEEKKGDLVLDFSKLSNLSSAVGRERLVLDLSCRKHPDRPQDGYFVVANRWQTFTQVALTKETLSALSIYCDEFLVHGVDVEGKQQGVDHELVELLAELSPIPVTYAGGIRSLDDCTKLRSRNLGFTVGSALSIFGGSLALEQVAEIGKVLKVAFLDYGGGNVRSLRNAIRACGAEPVDVESVEDIRDADRLIFPGVGAFGTAVENLKRRGFFEALREYVQSGKPFFGICLGMQVLFEGSEESPEVEGLGILPGMIKRFTDSPEAPVPHIGWNHVYQPTNCGATTPSISPVTPFDNRKTDGHGPFYFVHSFRVPATFCACCSLPNQSWVAAHAWYGSGGDRKFTENKANTRHTTPFVAAVQLGNIFATQFHPEKSGVTGLQLLKRFLHGEFDQCSSPSSSSSSPSFGTCGSTSVSDMFVPTKTLTKRVIACLDVRSNANGDIVVTKGDQYDCREGNQGDDAAVRNLGKPVELATRYYTEGADEVTFLNITAFGSSPLADQPMLEVLRRSAQQCFVPLTVGGGIRSFTDSIGNSYSALEVAAEYFRAGADKVSIGSDAVRAAEAYWANNAVSDGKSSIATISQVYGAQAVVVSVDPRRVYVQDPSQAPDKHCVRMTSPRRYGPNGEEWAWYQCTIRGGREGRDLDANALAVACQAMGAGELLVNCINEDGQGQGFDLDLMQDLSTAVSIPLIASSGAGSAQHFVNLFEQVPSVTAGLAAGMFHHKRVSIATVKDGLGDAARPVTTIE